MKGTSSRSLAPTAESMKQVSGVTTRSLTPNTNVMSSSSRSPDHQTTADLSHTLSFRDILIDSSQTNTTDKSKVVDDNKFTLVEKRKRKKFANMSGTGTGIGSAKLQVAQLSTAVYVSRLNKATSPDDIQAYVSEMGEKCVKVELLTQKHDTEFVSFKVTIDKSRLERFLCVDFWPAGVRFRRFREYTARGIKNFNN